MPQTANAIITKARTLYGRMLAPAQYEELLHRQSVQEVCAYLKEKTTYAGLLANVQESAIHRGQLENLLHKDMFYQYVRLARYMPQKSSAARFVVLDMEIELILSRLRGLVSHKQEDAVIAELPAFMAPYASFDIYRLAKAETFADLTDALEGSNYAGLLRECGSPDAGTSIPYAACEAKLRTWYFQTLLKDAGRTAHGRTRKELRQILSLRAEVMNLHTIYRMKAYFNAGPQAIRQLLLPVSCSLNRRELEQLIEAADAQEFMKRLCHTAYGKHLDPQETFLEDQTENIRYRVNLHLLRFSSDPQVVFTAYLLLRGMETENIIRIVEGVRYGMPPEKIRRLLYRM